MGLLKPPLNKQKAQLITKVKNDENGGDNCYVPSSLITSNNALQNPLPSDSAYNSWLLDHPSALGSFEKMMKVAKGKRIVVFLDYDGTLSPIVDDPDRAFMSDEMRSAVREVAKYFPTAIISGRSRDKVKEFVRLRNVYYAGSHGMDILAPARPLTSSIGITDDKKAGKDVHFQPAHKFLPAIQEILGKLEEKTMNIQGAKIEDNRFCLSVHFRRVRDEDYSMLEGRVRSVLQNYPEFHLTEGKKVMEIRPSIEWNKGHALKYLLDTLGFNNSNHEVLPMYIGDDRTDEDAFRVLQSQGQGFPILVSSSPKETRASYSLRDPFQVLNFLLHLARWRISSSTSRSMLNLLI